MSETEYDYIITGAGCAGLSLAVHLLQSGRLSEKKILLVDERLKNKNDRTWCFWEKGEGPFESIVHKQWKHLWFYGEAFYKEFAIAPYRYKMIRGIDFYTYCFNLVSQHKNIEFLQAKVEAVFSDERTGIVADGKKIYAEFVFNSLLFEKPKLSAKQQWLLQHFKGWTIRTEEDTFDSYVATLMDFRVLQLHGTTFCYVLPVSPREALIEYTLFTASTLPDKEYDEALKNYIENILHLDQYTVVEKETGVIPMTDYHFPSRNKNILNIGTAGGQTKGSSGYTFYFIQKHSKAIVDNLIKTGNPFVKAPSARFGFYDSVLLNILANNTLPGKQIFSELFKKNKAPQVLKFLNNETSLAEELRLIATLPTLPFMKAAINRSF